MFQSHSLRCVYIPYQCIHQNKYNSISQFWSYTTFHCFYTGKLAYSPHYHLGYNSNQYLYYCSQYKHILLHQSHTSKHSQSALNKLEYSHHSHLEYNSIHYWYYCSHNKHIGTHPSHRYSHQH